MGSINPIALREFRKIRGRSVRELAADAGIDSGYLSRLETGQYQNPSDGIVNRLSVQLGIPVAAIAVTCRHEAELRAVV